jgi:hypothetical protein
MSGIDGFTKFCSHLNELPFIDEVALSITNYNVTLDEVIYKFSPGSAYFNGSDAYLELENSSVWDMAGGNFTYDFWFYPRAESRMALFSGSSDYWIGLDYHFQGTRNVNLWASSNGFSWDLINADPGGNGIGTISLNLNAWNHIALVRNGNNWRTYLNGIHDVDITVTGSIINKSEVKRIGNWGTGSYKLFGNIDEPRYSEGVVRWANDFIPPTSEYNASTAEIINSDSTIIANINTETIESDSYIVAEVLYNVNNKISFTKRVLSDVNNKFNMVKLSLKDINNMFNMVKGLLYDIRNDFRTKKLQYTNIRNDIRFIKSWQKGTIGGFKSLGKEYIKVYIATVENTNVDVDSITFSRVKNQPHTASFELAQAYDSTKPTEESAIEIKYADISIYSGYITSISPTDSPEKIRIECQDEYWKQNKVNNLDPTQTNKYFYVGHKPTDNKEKYYETIKSAVATEYLWNIDIGNFVPETIDCFAKGASDVLADLIQQCGNYGFYYDVNKNKKLWRAGEGSVINLNRQVAGTNLGLYDVIEHKFSENIDQIVNKLRVQMGNKIIKTQNGGSRTYEGYNYESYERYVAPAWDASYEVLAKWSGNGYGWDWHKPEDNRYYNDIFKKYTLPALDPELSSWSDRYAPYVEIYNSGGWEIYNAPSAGSGNVYRLTEGFTIDYENSILTLNDPTFLYTTNSNGECVYIKAPIVKVFLWKKNFWTVTLDPSDNPESDIGNDLMFFTDKMGSYSETIMKDLNLSSYGIQVGYETYDGLGNKIIVPSWDDTDFAEDMANWQLSKTCDKKIRGNITVTLDTLCFYGIDLDKRIYISGITDEIMNVISIDVNMNTFTASIELENSRSYTRTVSLPAREV